MHKRVVGPYAGLARVQALAPGDALGGATDVGIGGDEHRALPPSSRVTLVRFWAAAVMISRPTRGLPVNMILSEFHLQQPVVRVV